MIDWSNFFFYFFIIGAAFFLSVVGLWFTAILPGIDRWSKGFFRCYFFVLMLCCFFSFLEMLLSYFGILNKKVYIVLFFETLLLSMPLPMLTVYLLHCCKEDLRESRLLHASLGLWAIFFILLLWASYPGSFTHFLPGGTYQREPLYPLLLLPLVAIMLLNLAGTIRRRKKLSHKTLLSFLVAILPMTLALFVHLFIDVFPLLDIGIVLTGLSMYSLILSDQIEQELRHQSEIAQQQLEIARQQTEIARQQTEIAQQRTNMMVLEMRPHFIFNTMTSIYCLCKKDPVKAQQMILDFTTYLRDNFTAIASVEPIPFSSELEHTKAYLAVEQALYEDSLLIEYDTPHTWFRIPPLTLQTIVENSIKHGRDPYHGPLHISIRTRKMEDRSEIVVTDDGRGFTPSKDAEPHIALNNIRQRLELSGGDLTITPREGGGTVVSVWIPDKTY